MPVFKPTCRPSISSLLMVIKGRVRTRKFPSVNLRIKPASGLRVKTTSKMTTKPWSPLNQYDRVFVTQSAISTLPSSAEPTLLTVPFRVPCSGAPGSLSFHAHLFRCDDGPNRHRFLHGNVRSVHFRRRRAGADLHRETLSGVPQRGDEEGKPRPHFAQAGLRRCGELRALGEGP